MRSFSLAVEAGIWQVRRTVWPREIIAGLAVHFCAAAGEAIIAESAAARSVPQTEFFIARQFYRVSARVMAHG